MDIKKLRDLAQKKESRIIELRRQLHQYPELAFEEVRTAQLICEELERLGIEVHTQYAETTAVIGVIRGEKPGPTRALRADMDALPVQEETGLPFASKIPGKMHACGHDAHMAILLGTAHILSQSTSQLAGNIVLVFQPAEEAGKAGAQVLVKHGLIEEFGIEAMFGHHVWAELPAGQFATRPGVITSNSDIFTVEIHGKGAHAARPHMGIDPVVISSHFVLASQELISREIIPHEPAVLTLTSLQAGNSYNVIPEKAILKGTARTQSLETQDVIEKRLGDVLTGITSMFRATATYDYQRVYPCVVNHEDLTANIMNWSHEFWGEDNTLTFPHALMIGEDFAFYAQKIPCCFGFIGIGSEYDHHSPYFMVNELILTPATAWTAYIVFKYAELAYVFRK
jgi:amidohydrolase